MAITCEVPVLPPLVYGAPANTAALVPSLFTPTMARLMVAIWSGFQSSLRSGCGSTGVRTLVATFSM